MEDLALDKRLSLAASMVEGEAVADIGTDHGKLPVFLIKKGAVKKAYACDIKSGPLGFAEALVKEQGLESKIELRLTDGLRGLPLSEITDIVIAGMGGETIFQILEDAMENQSFPSHINLVLNPMTKAERLRESLYSSGFFIKEEKAAEDSGRIYSVMKCGFSGEKKEIDGAFKFLGKIDTQTQEGQLYLKNTVSKLKKSLKNPQNEEELSPILEKLLKEMEK